MEDEGTALPTESDTTFSHTYKAITKRHELTYLELYSGIGGWGLALHEACQRVSGRNEIQLHRVAALDRSDIANQVFQYNCSSCSSSSSNNKTSSIEKLTISQLESAHRADVWIMSPPCQPYTRNNDSVGKESGDLTDETDKRSASLLHLCRLLGNTKEYSEDALPRLILMENVIGFESVRLLLVLPKQRSFLCLACV